MMNYKMCYISRRPLENEEFIYMYDNAIENKMTYFFSQDPLMCPYNQKCLLTTQN